MKEIKTYNHPDCEHICSSNCRREGCNCLCGEWHGSLDEVELAQIKAEQQEKTWIDAHINYAVKEGYIDDEAYTWTDRQKADYYYKCQAIDKEEMNEIQEDTTSMEEKLVELNQK